MHFVRVTCAAAAIAAGCGGASSERLPGADDALALAALPDREAPPHAEDDWIELGAATVSRTRVVVVVEERATLGEVNDLLARLGARVLGSAAELWSLDRDFGRFSPLAVRNPLAD